MEVFLLILFFVIIIGVAIKSGKKGTTSQDINQTTPTIRTLAEWSTDELEEELSKVEVDLEMQKMKYQSSLANPYVLNVTRNLVKTNLEYLFERKQKIQKELDKRKQ